MTAARAALSGAASVAPKSRNGPVEQMRVLLVFRRSARLQRAQSLNQLRHLVFTAPEPIRARFKDRPQTGLVKEAAAMRPNPASDPVVYTTNLARRIRGLTREVKDIDRMLKEAGRTECRPVGPLRGRTRRSRHPPGHSRRQPRTNQVGTVMGPPLRSNPHPSITRQNGQTPAQPRR